MATADVDAKTEGEEGVEPAPSPTPSPSPSPSLAWDESVKFRPIGLGWDSEPVVLDWSGRGTAELLVLANGGRSARLYRPTGDGDFPRPYDAGSAVEGLGGLRCVCPIPNGRASRFDLVALAPEGLVLLRNGGEPDRPSFEAREPLGPPVGLGLGSTRTGAARRAWPGRAGEDWTWWSAPTTGTSVISAGISSAGDRRGGRAPVQ